MGRSAEELLWICPKFQLVKIKPQSQKVVPTTRQQLLPAITPSHHGHVADLLEKVAGGGAAAEPGKH